MYARGDPIVYLGGGVVFPERNDFSLGVWPEKSRIFFVNLC